MTIATFSERGYSPLLRARVLVHLRARRRDDLKRDLRRILLLFVSGDDLKRDLRQILLLFVHGDGVNR